MLHQHSEWNNYYVFSFFQILHKFFPIAYLNPEAYGEGNLENHSCIMVQLTQCETTTIMILLCYKLETRVSE